MAELSTDLLEIVLKDVAAAGAEPWYAAAYAQATGIPRDRLDASLDRLRLAGLVRLTDWVQGRGQGYTLTGEGANVLHHPRLLDRLREGRELPRRAEALPAAAAPRSLREPGTAYGRGEAIRAALLDQSRPAMTQTLVLANVLVFAFGLWLAARNQVFDQYLGFSAGNPTVNAIRHETGGLRPGDLERGQWWRLLTYCFVHGGALHLLMNMYVLYSIGGLVEKLWAPGRYLAMYLIAGVGGAVMHMMFQAGGIVGASGSICGLLGSMAAWVWLNRAYLPPPIVANWMRNLMMNALLIAFISMVPGVSWGGHLGGALAGAVVSVPLNFTRFGRGPERWLGWLGVAAVPALAVGLLYGSVSAKRGGDPEVRADLPANDPRVQEARAVYLPIYRIAGALADKVYQQHAAQFLSKGVDPRADSKASKEAVKEAVAHFKDASQKLLGLSRKLADAEKFRNADITEHVGDLRNYVQAWGLFFRHFADGLEPPANWTEERRQRLHREWRAAENLREPLLKSTLFRATLEEAP